MADDSPQSFFVVEEIDYSGDPQEVLERRITPRVLRRLDELIDAEDPRVNLQAAKELREMDRRFERKAAGGVNMQFNFPPEYVKAALSGAQGVIRDVSPKKRLAKADKAVDKKRLAQK